MAKLYFRFGAMGSAKTLNLLAVAHNYRQQRKKVLLIKPQIDLRFGVNAITSRAGLTCDADLLVSEKSYFTLNGNDLISNNSLKKNPKNEIVLDNKLDYSCFLVDEAQFLTKELVEALYEITILCNIPVIAYGLKTDFRNFLFEGSKRLLELSDTIEEIKTTCFYCEKKATHNIRLVGEKPVFTGETVDIGADEKYRPCCKMCLHKLKSR